MVKLFVGGLPEGVDSIRLRQLFSQFVIVNECDVIKDYAFVHVADEESVRIAMEKLDGYILEGKAINIRRSTSKLRREPGMDKRCYRCGSSEHKTPQCPQDPALKRANSSNNVANGAPPEKRAAGSSPSYTPTIKIDLTGRTPEASSAASQGSYSYSQSQGVQGQPAGTTAPLVDPDAELPRPVDSDLIPLYEQYLESRTKYFYFRERLTKEVKARAQLAPYAPAAALQAPYATNVYGAYQPHQQPYAQQTTTVAAPYATGQHFYSNSVSSNVVSTMQGPATAMPSTQSATSIPAQPLGTTAIPNLQAAGRPY